MMDGGESTMMVPAPICHSANDGLIDNNHARGPAQVRMTHAATNTTSAGLAHHQQPISADDIGEAATQPKKRGPKPGRRAASLAAGGYPTLANWQHHGPPPPFSPTTNYLANSQSQQAGDPYAFQCNDPIATTINYETDALSDKRQHQPPHDPPGPLPREATHTCNNAGRPPPASCSSVANEQTARNPSATRANELLSPEARTNSFNTSAHSAELAAYQSTQTTKGEQQQLNNNNRFQTQKTNASTNQFLDSSANLRHQQKHFAPRFQGPNCHQQPPQQQLSNVETTMIAHKPQGPMQPVAGAAGATAPQMQRQQAPPPASQMVHHHHALPINEQANYYNANEQYIQTEPQAYHQDMQAAPTSRFVPSRPQQQYHPQQVPDQLHHHHHHHHQQQQQQTQPQVPPHQLPYQTNGYVEQQPNNFPAGDPLGLPNRNQLPVGRPQRPTPYANQQQQQPVPVRQPIAAQNATVPNNRVLPARQQQQQHHHHQVYKPTAHNHQPPQNPSPHHHHQAANLPHHHQQQALNYPNQQNGGPYHVPHPTQSGSFVGDPTANEQYASNSPTLLQQQLNRQRPAPPVVAQPIQRVPNNFRPVVKPRPMLGGPPLSQPQSSRFGGPEQAQEMSLVEPYAEQANHGRHQAGGPYYQQQQQPVSRIQQAQQQQRPPLRQPIQQQMPPTPMDNHLLGNPTPPLTPNAPNAPHLRPNCNLTSPDDWPQRQQQSQHGPLNDHMQQQPPPAVGGFNGACVTPSPQQMNPHKSPSIHHHPQQQGQQQHIPHLNGGVATLPNGLQAQRTAIMPKTNVTNNNNNINTIQYHANNHNHAPTSQQQQMPIAVPSSHQHQQPNQHQHHHQSAPLISIEQHQQQPGATTRQPHQLANDLPTSLTNQVARLTLPLRDAPLLGPFRLDHDAQFTSKVFHIKPQLFDTLSKSISLMNPQTATVIQELQFRAYLVNSPSGKSTTNGDSLLASNNQQQQINNQGKSCNWPELFQLSVNQQVIPLDRSKQSHRAVDIFQFCHLGDNVLDIQVNDCYCTHEFVLEAVDRPTVKAFMNSCFKSRLLAQESCIQKLKFNFGAPGFLIQNSQLQSAEIFNEYITEYIQGIEQTRAKFSLKCSISARRMRTPTRGHNCKHLQCFDLENFLYLNRERSQWNCPICSLPIPFNMLELDQHQINILQSMSDLMNTDDILVDSNGQWQAYYGQQQQQQQNVINPHPPQQHQTTAKSNGTFHPQPPFSTGNGSPAPPQMNLGPSGSVSRPQQPGSSGSPASWDSPQQIIHNIEHGSASPIGSNAGGAVRRPMSALSQPPPPTGRRSANGSPLAKRPYAGQHASPQPIIQSPSSSASFQQQPSSQSFGGENTDDLSPLAAMERTIIQHEQQMGPPPFDPSSLTSNPLRNSAPAPGTSAIVSQSPTAPPMSGSPAHNSQATNLPPPQQQQIVQSSPEARSINANSNFSPIPHTVSSPARMVPASPQQHQPPPQSPIQQQLQQPNVSISTPATPSSSVMVHGGPETPATPSNSSMQQHCGPNSVLSHSPHISSTNIGGAAQPTTGVDHQPLSNGSASAGSITSTSTMTPSGQSLGSVGMGGDSRCNTAPLQGNLGLDDLMLPGGSTSTGSQFKSTGQSDNCSGNLDDKNEILMRKLMMDSNRSGELAMALEEAEWNQQLDRGKSEHLANFLNEPLMNKKHHRHQYQQSDDGANKMLSGGLNPSDDEGNQSHSSSPGANIDQLDQFANYLDSGTADDGAGLPPDDSILDLFER